MTEAFIRSYLFLNYYSSADSLKVMTPGEYNGLLSGLDIQIELTSGLIQ